MKTEELFAEIIKNTKWYKPLGYTYSKGYNYKWRFENGGLREKTIRRLLTDLGYEQIWVKKEE